VLWAEHVARNTAGSRDDVFDEVRRHFNDAELVELTGVCGLFAQSNRFQDSLKLPIEPPHEVDKIRQSVRVDPERMRAYVGRLVETWPTAFPSPAQPAARGRPKPASALPNGAREEACRVPLPDPATAGGDAGWYLRATQELLGAVPSFARLWAHVPHLGKLLLPLPIVLTREGAGAALPAATRALALVATSRENAAPYSLAHHAAMARTAGITAEKLSAIESGTAAVSPALEPLERATISWAGHVARNSAKDHDDAFEALRAHFGDAEIVELTALCAVANKMDRIHNALRLPLEPAAEFEALHRSERVDPARLRDYLAAIASAWPQALPVPAP
jgi:AhpD family alkylhydroperoxidase